MQNTFDRVVVINLKRRNDRLKQFQAELAKARWPFKKPEIVPAVDGRLVPNPKNWKGGPGARGCWASHIHVLEQAMTDKVDNVLVLEDDAFFVEGFAAKVEAFLADVPKEWDGLFLGGQHISPAKELKPGVVKCRNCQRTHAYALKNGKFMRDVYETWLGTNSHIDHCFGPLQEAYNVYAPDPFLIGQDESQSDIMGNAFLHKRLWSKAPDGLPVILLKTTHEIKERLADRLHYGYDIDRTTKIDKGLLDAFRQHDPTHRLRKFVDEVGGEAWLVGKHPAIWHQAATVEIIEKVHKPVVLVEADTLEKAVALLPSHAAPPTPPIVLLRASREVADELAAMGFHRGYWLNHDGVDNGLRAMFATKQGEALIEALRAWIGLVGAEAKKIRNGVLTVWHPEATFDLLQKATDQRIIEIAGSSAEIASASFRLSAVTRLAAPLQPNRSQLFGNMGWNVFPIPDFHLPLADNFTQQFF